MLSRDAATDLIRRANPDAMADRIAMYVAQFMIYGEASENMQANGAIVAHPRTGAPIENPYGKLLLSSGAAMRQIGAMWDVSALWDHQGE